MTTALVPASMSEAEQLAQRLAQSSLAPDALRGKPHDVLAIVLTGLELGLSPMQALRGIYVVKGRPVLAADTLVALCVRSEHCLYFRRVESTDKVATYETHRKGHPEPVRLSWTSDMAKRAGLGGQTWSAHPEAMLRHRCAAALARDVYPDLVLGMYEESEGAEMAARPEPRVEVVEPKALPPPPESLDVIRERIAGAVDLVGLEALVPQLQRLAPADREAVRPDYSKRKAEFTKPAEVKP